MHYKSPRRRREKRTANLFKKLGGKNFPNLEKEIINKIHEAQKIHECDKTRLVYIEPHYNQFVKSQRQENFENNKNK